MKKLERNAFIAIAIAVMGPLYACGTTPDSDEETDNVQDEPKSVAATSGAGGGTPTPGRSGETICNNADDCGQSLSCEHSSLGTTGICVEGCATNADCGTGTLCIDGTDVGFEPSCLARCDSSVDCGAGMDCFALGDGSQVCLPPDWVEPAPTSKGIGDACSQDGECRSNWCLGGWCTDYCSPTDSFCGGDYGGKNEFDQWNWCVLNNAGNYVCFPGCTGASSVCSNYDGVSCQSGTAVDGITVNICSG